MSSSEESEFRVSDAERQSALDALGEHLSSGRLDVDEYGDRSAQITTAKTRGELSAVFRDLPEPRPHFGAIPALGTQQARRDGVEVKQQLPGQGALNRVFNALVPLSALLALVLFFTVARGHWLVFLLPVAVTLVAGAVLGDERHNHRRRHHR